MYNFKTYICFREFLMTLKTFLNNFKLHYLVSFSITFQRPDVVFSCLVLSIVDIAENIQMFYLHETYYA